MVVTPPESENQGMPDGTRRGIELIRLNLEAASSVSNYGFAVLELPENPVIT
jgi:hypothetical protein